MAKRLKDLRITHVSYVKKGANGKDFFLLKSDENPSIQKEVRIIANNNDPKKLVYGVVYEPNVLDSQGEFADAISIEKAAHNFLADSRNIDLQHNFKSDFGTVVESYVAPADFEINGNKITKGSWVLVTKANDDVWEKIINGEINAYSMGGQAERVEDNLFGISKASDDEYRGFFDVLKTFFAKKSDINYVAKAGKVISDSNAQKIRLAHKALTELLDIVDNVREDERGEEKDEEKKEPTQIEKEDLQQIINESLKVFTQRLDKIEKGFLDDTCEFRDDKDYKKHSDDLAQVIKSTINEAIEPINSRLNVIERRRNLSKQQEELQKSSSSENIFQGLFFN